MPSEEDNMKLLAAFCILNGDYDRIATYMGITKNAAYVVADPTQQEPY